MKKLLHLFGKHFWIKGYENGYKIRTCSVCGIKQRYINEGAIGGFSDYEYWQNI